MISLQTDITYVVNTENLVRKSSHLKDKCFILHVIVMETYQLPVLTKTQCLVYTNTIIMAAQTATLLYLQ